MHGGEQEEGAELSAFDEEILERESCLMEFGGCVRLKHEIRELGHRQLTVWVAAYKAKQMAGASKVSAATQALTRATHSKAKKQSTGPRGLNKPKLAQKGDGLERGVLEGGTRASDE